MRYKDWQDIIAKAYPMVNFIESKTDEGVTLALTGPDEESDAVGSWCPHTAVCWIDYSGDIVEYTTNEGGGR